jgi:hypothetical protein
MQKKLETQEIDMPIDDIECWYRYPKHRWVYDMSRLLDVQNIKWSPFDVPGTTQEIIMELYSTDPIIKQPGYIYISLPRVDEMITEVYITKGEIKLIRHIDPNTNKELPGLIGGIELKLNAFVTLHFSKFTGVISVRTSGIEIHRIQLRPYAFMVNDTNAEAFRLKKRIYKRTNIIVSGPADQALHESIAS